MAEVWSGGVAVSLNQESLHEMIAQFRADHPGVMQPAHDGLFSGIAIRILPMHLDRMRSVINAVEALVALPLWQQYVLAETGQHFLPSNPGVFFGYDFHLDAEGVHLIEINTNAGGGFLAALMEESQQDLDGAGQAVNDADPAHLFVEMFRREWYLQRGMMPLRNIAIVDEQPLLQYFYPEFVQAKTLFEKTGIQVFIVDPAEISDGADGLEIDGVTVDMVYNRLTDFSLQKYPHLLNAFLQHQVVLTPHPQAYALYADKRNLCLLSDADFLRRMGLDESNIAVLQDGVPQTRKVEAAGAEQWWAGRKDWFFKPATGYGGKGSYRGDKLTRRVFEEIVHGGYVAQRKAMPPEVLVSVDGAEPVPFKYDVRCYVYEGVIQMVVARLYQGQTTNFRTPGGGFALVRTGHL